MICSSLVMLPSGAGLAERLEIAAPPHLQCRVCVIVPVRNEAENIFRTLSALANQVDYQGRSLPYSCYEVLLFANNCTDASADIAHYTTRQYPGFAVHIVERVMPPEESYIGRVRQLLMNEAYYRLRQLGRGQGIIASTDGDTQVSPTWVYALMQDINNGADAVGGRIVTHRSIVTGDYARTYHLRSVGYRMLALQLEDYITPDPSDPAPRHFQFYGANFAVTCQAYARAGGLPPVRTPEDVAFRDALIRVGARLRHSPMVRVATSARHHGRTSIGLANQLAAWQSMGQRQQTMLVEPAAAVEVRLLAKRDLRTLWQRARAALPQSAATVGQLAARFAVSAEWLQEAIAQLWPFEFLYQQVERQQQEEGLWQQCWELTPIEAAIADLRLRVAQRRYPNRS